MKGGRVPDSGPALRCPLAGGPPGLWAREASRARQGLPQPHVPTGTGCVSQGDASLGLPPRAPPADSLGGWAVGSPLARPPRTPRGF